MTTTDLTDTTTVAEGETVVKTSEDDQKANPEGDQATFPASYVQELRDEAARHRAVKNFPSAPTPRWTYVRPLPGSSYDCDLRARVLAYTRVDTEAHDG